MGKFTDSESFHILTLGGCTSGGALLGGIIAGQRGSWIGAIVGFVIGVWNWRTQRNHSSRG